MASFILDHGKNINTVGQFLAMAVMLTVDVCRWFFRYFRFAAIMWFNEGSFRPGRNGTGSNQPN
uniref:Uncharacterized protein n=1 Tax=Anguilla anguilla TaxID=7936 RepID=A0A0E9WVR6_ANGAN